MQLLIGHIYLIRVSHEFKVLHNAWKGRCFAGRMYSFEPAGCSRDMVSVVGMILDLLRSRT